MPSMTINTTSEQAQRVAAAFGKQLNLVDENDEPRDATAAEIKAATIDYIKTTVLRQEQRAAAQVASDAVEGIEPT